MINSTSRLSNAHANKDKAASTTKVKNWTEDSQTYITKECQTSARTNIDARLCG